MESAAMLREGLTPLNGFLRIDAAIGDATEALRMVSESPRLDAELLLARALDVPRSYLFAHAEEEMDAAAVNRYQSTIGRRVDGVPLAYITGEKEFWSMMLVVSPATLVPRPETETLVDQALMRIPKREQLRVLDLGTGCGAIALAIAKERPHCEVVATDISEDALAVARVNAGNLMIPNIKFMQGNWTDPLGDQMFDIIVSNPPYIADKDQALESLKHEPRNALASGNDGLDAIGTIAAAAGAILNPGGTLLIEHGAEQDENIAKILAANNWLDIILVKDLSMLPRVTLAIR
jgi:release factor glutamine methyltransferase